MGHAPFPEGSLAQRLLKHQKAKPTPVLDKRPETPPELVLICNRMMEKDREKRTQSAIEVAEQLSAYLATRGKQVTGAGDSGAGSQIGLAASVVRELANARRLNPDEDLNDVDTLIATLTEKSAEKDTTISRSQEETRKPLKKTPGLVPADDDDRKRPDLTAKSQSSKPTSPSSVTPMSTKPVPPAEIEALEKQLAPLSHSFDPLNAQLQGGTRLQSRKEDGPAVPPWIWGVIGVVVVLLLLVIGRAGILKSESSPPRRSGRASCSIVILRGFCENQINGSPEATAEGQKFTTQSSEYKSPPSPLGCNSTNRTRGNRENGVVLPPCSLLPPVHQHPPLL